MIYEFKISGDNEAILDFRVRDVSNGQLRNDNVQAFDTERDEVLSAVTDRSTENILESLFKMQVEKLKELKSVLQVLRSGDDVRRQETGFLHIYVEWSKDISSRKSRLLISNREIEMRTDLQ